MELIFKRLAQDPSCAAQLPHQHPDIFPSALSATCIEVSALTAPVSFSPYPLMNTCTGNVTFITLLKRRVQM